MITTANFIELQRVISADCGDPHHILGMHEIEKDGKAALVVRALNPQAKEISVIDVKKGTEYPLEKIHQDGFFEGLIKGRRKWFKYKLKITNHDGSVWETYDPYSFAPQISEYDCFLFAQGNHYEIYKKLGANAATVDGVEGVVFGVWAPNAKRVSVIGDFNDWDARRNQMRELYSEGVWEIFIPGLKNFDRYKYEIKTPEGTTLQKQDPYGVMCELRPSTSSLVFNIYNYQWQDGEYMENIKTAEKYDRPMNIYEVHMGSWKRPEDDPERFLSYVELKDMLIPYVVEMGYTHIELLPIEEHPFDGSWGYQVTGYYAPTSRYGTPNEFKEFVDAAHRAGIGVILDWVPAHFPKDAHGLARFDGSCLYEHANPMQGEHPEWGTLIFNYGRCEVKNFLISNALYWVEQYHIDGLRVDAVSSMLYLDYAKSAGQWVPNKYGGRENLEAIEFIKHMNSVMKGYHPNVYMIAEESTSYEGITKDLDNGGLGFSLKWNMGWMNDFLEYVKKEPIYRRYHHNNLTFGMMYAYSERFVLVLSHDEVVHGKQSMLDKQPGDLWQKFAGLRVSYGYQSTFPGKNLVFMGGEFGQFIEWDEKRPLDWFLLEYPHHSTMLNYVKDLNNLYLKEEALWVKDFSWEGFEWVDANDCCRSIYSFIRKGNSKAENILVVCNFTPSTYFDYKTAVPFAGKWQEIFNSDKAEYGGSGVTNPEAVQSQPDNILGKENSISFKLAPLAIHMFKPVEFEE
ncbi:MAG: 1,4-alpha-glucan branching protein GlgB [Clostridiales bacterium]|nr:1,4-alpha-glucan branching protein GlgB [Clostridiales bacterium]